MDLYSNMCQEKWTPKNDPPKKLRGTGYHQYDLFRASATPDYIEYFMSSTTGDPCTLLLYGSKSDPLKSVGHCNAKHTMKNGNHVITGLIVEEDWMEIKDDFLATIDPPQAVDERRKLSKQESFNIGLTSDLKKDKWTNKGKPPRNKTKLGYGYCNIVRSHPEVHDGVMSYYLTNDDGVPFKGDLEGAFRDPLKSVGNCYLKMSDNNIKGIILEDEWVEMLEEEEEEEHE